MRLLVFGGRDYSDKTFLYAVLDHIHQTRGITEIIEGGASGADRLARQWAKDRGVKVVTVNADWTLGRKAGPIRNTEMAKMNPDAAIGFPGGRGTEDMARKAARFGIPLLAPNPTGNVASQKT